MKKTSFMLLSMLFLIMIVGCSNRSGIVLIMGHIGGDLRITTIASGNQQRDDGETSFAGSTSGSPMAGIPAIDALFAGKGQSRTAKIWIDSVSGTVIFESIASGNQGIDPQTILDKLNITGDPPDNQEYSNEYREE